MTLTIGTGPFGPQSSGVFNFTREGPEHVLYWEDTPKRVRCVFAGETVADSRRVKLLHETGLLPVYYFPLDDVRRDLLEATEHKTHCPFKGDASYWSVRVGDRVAENVVWSYPEPLDGAPPLAGYVALFWDEMEEWYEEDERAYVHARDPYHRVDVLRSSRHVKVSLAGELLAESHRPLILFETGLPPRYYLPEEDVRSELLVPSDSTSRCPYKGVAAYHSVKTGQDVTEDLVWTYREPLDEVVPIRGHLSFFNERVDLELDGVLQERPTTRWS